MTRRQRIAVALDALTHRDWVTLAVCLALLVVLVVSILGLAQGLSLSTK